MPGRAIGFDRFPTRVKGRDNVGSLTEGNLPDVDTTPTDAAPTIVQADGPRPAEARPRRFGRRSPAKAAGDAKPRRRRRRPGAVLVRILRRIWIPVVIVAVLAAGGLTVSRLQGLFGSEKSEPYGDTRTDSSKPFDPKVLRYEIFGPAGTTADVSFFDGDGEPRFLEGVTLPWSLEFPISTTASVGSVAAQGDSETLGCRITIDGEIKSEKIATHEVSTFTSCLLKAA